MTLPASGAITFSQIDVELGYSSTAQIGLNCSAVRTLFGQSSGAICMNTGHGKSNSISASYLVVAGGGAGGGFAYGGGGGAGGLLCGTTCLSPSSCYTVVVGAGGKFRAAFCGRLGGNGTNSYISGTGVSITAIGGGGGIGSYSGYGASSGGSGGGGSGGASGVSSGGAGTCGQGYAGACGSVSCSNWPGGGGGASQRGHNVYTGSCSKHGYACGGYGKASTLITTSQASSNTFGFVCGSSVYFACGGGGSSATGNYNFAGWYGGYGGGGGACTCHAHVNTGSGGGGFYSSPPCSNTVSGGSGIVIIAYTGSAKFSGGLIMTNAGKTVHVFKSSGTLAHL